MSKCSTNSKTEAATEHHGDASTKAAPLSFSQEQREESPLMRALRTHFKRYNGLTEPKVSALRPQTDDL